MAGDRTLRARLSGRVPMAFGVSGPLATGLMPGNSVGRLISGARKAGISIFDTGPSYGNGRAEHRLGAAIGEHADVFVMTKAGVQAGGRRDFSPSAIRASVDASAERLKRRTIDLLWLHGAARHELTAQLVATLQKLREEGRVASFGLAGRTDDVLAGEEAGLFEAVMLPVHQGLEEADLERVRQAKETGRMVFAIEALGGLKREPELTPGTLWRFAKRVAGRGGKAGGLSSTPEAAFAWAVQEGGADIVVTSTTSTQRLVQNAQTFESYRR